MSETRTNALIEALAGEAEAVEPLRPPLRRAVATLAGLSVAAGAAVVAWSPLDPMAGADDRTRMGLELIAMLATGVLAVTGAFYLSIPGRSRRWMMAPLLPLAAWLALTGIGCLTAQASGPMEGDCFAFILATSLALGLPLAWALGRATPVDPLPVALLGALGSAALAALVLQFFHPFAITFLDLGMHVAAVAIVVGAAGLLNRRMLRVPGVTAR
jgi:hypothetical protein